PTWTDTPHGRDVVGAVVGKSVENSVAGRSAPAGGAMTGNFRRALLPPPRPFYAKELGKLTRPSRGWARGNCPFHKSKSRKSISLNVDTGAFDCHGCGAHGGDVLSFVMQRDKVDFKCAAASMGAWDDNGNISADEIRKAKVERERRQAEQQEKEEQERRQRIE